MKLTVKIEGRSFEVEIGDLNSRPVLALVDGERFEVWPEGDTAPRRGSPPAGESAPRQTQGGVPAAAAVPSHQVLAPIPGVIDSIQIQAGDEVQSGTPLCILEAMKMKNTIRAPRPGEIAAVKVASGQHVQHGDVLVEFVE